MRHGPRQWFEGGRERPKPKTLGIVAKKEGSFVWIRIEGKKEPVRVFAKNAGEAAEGASVVFTATGMYGIGKRPGVFVESGVLELETPETKEPPKETADASTVLPLPDESGAALMKNGEGVEGEELQPIELGEVGEPEDVPADALREEVADIEETPRGFRELSESEREAAGAPEHVISLRYNKSKPEYSVRVGERKYKLAFRDVRRLYLMPGDKVSIVPLNKYDALVADVDYQQSPYIAGYVEKNERTGRLNFVVRRPGEHRTLKKIPMSAEFPGAEEAAANGRIVLFDRKEKRVIEHADFKKSKSSYETLKRMVLTNMGVNQYNRESEDLKRREKAELAKLLADHGVHERGSPKTLDARLAPAIERQVEEEKAAGKILDLRGSNGGRRFTFYIDPFGSKDHDDAISIEDIQGETDPATGKPEHEGWYQIGVHIADVARYVKTGSAIDLQSAFRATSIYLDDEVIRMLPPLISEHLASLNAGHTRFALSLLFDVKMEPVLSDKEKAMLAKMTDEERKVWWANNDDKRRPGRERKVRIENIRFAKTAIKVDEGLTYEEAERRMMGRRKDGSTEALRDLMMFAKALRERKGARNIGDDFDSDDMDVHEMVAEYMMVHNRATGAAYERFKRAAREDTSLSLESGVEMRVKGKPNLHKVQQLVQGIYRLQEAGESKGDQTYVEERVKKIAAGETLPRPRNWGDWQRELYEARRKKQEGGSAESVSQPSHAEVLLALGILEDADLAKDGAPVPFKELAELARFRVARGGYTPSSKSGKQARFKSFGKGVVEKYYRDADRSMKRDRARYGNEPGIHISMGIKRYTRTSSPIRRKADTKGQRRIQFELELDALAKKLADEGKDLDEETAIEWANRYAEKVVGIDLPEGLSAENVDFEAYMDTVAEAVARDDEETLAHDLRRERLATDAESTVASLHTVANVYGHLHGKGARDEEGRETVTPVEWRRGEETKRARSVRFERAYPDRKGNMVPEGLIIDFDYGDMHIDEQGYVYGELRITRRTNQALLKWVPRRAREQGARIAVKFHLPKGYEHPAKWCKDRGMERPRVKIPGAIIEAQVEQGRLIFGVKRKRGKERGSWEPLPQDEAYIDIRPPDVQEQTASGK